MLKELAIKNFAIIDDLKICFADGLTILSGETGAGKSVIISAVNLLLGLRASSKMIRDGCESAELAAFFDVPPGSVAAEVMAQNGYEPKDGLLVRRVIAANDRHRTYINDRMATIQMLAAITSDLASVSGQRAHQRLLRQETHLVMLDRFGGLLPLVREMADRYAQLVDRCHHLQTLQDKRKDLEKSVDLLQYQATEIAEAQILPGEDESLEQERLRLKHAEYLQRSVLSALDALHGADGAIVEQLGVLRKNLEKAADLDGGLKAPLQVLSDTLFSLEDVTQTLRTYLGGLESDADRLDVVETRLDRINRLKRKHGGSLAALLEARDTIEAELAAMHHLDEDIQRLEVRLQDDYDQVAALARTLSEKRGYVSSDFEANVERELEDLKMAGTRFRVHLSRSACGRVASPWLCVDGSLLSASGIDQAAFMIAPNLGESLKPLAEIASGGELSRVVLALKAILAEADAVGTVVFDEVDAGIGGAVADVVGKKLAALSKKHQLICITHLPQIARFGSTHYFIEKKVRQGRTTTTIRPMDQQERINELARMLGGETVTGTALEHARALMTP